MTEETRCALEKISEIISNEQKHLDDDSWREFVAELCSSVQSLETEEEEEEEI